MGLSTESLSPADIGAIMGNNEGFGGNGAWWIIILFLFAFMGGWNNNGNKGGVQDAYVLNSDFATLQRQLSDGFGALERKGDGIANGLCDGFYAQNTTMLNGFAGVNNAISTNGYETRNAIQQAQITEMQNANAIQSAISNCCCNTRESISNLGSTVQSGFCQTNFNNQSNTRDIIDAQNASTQAILSAIQQNKVEELQSRIAEQNQQINALQLSASQSAQNQYLISALKPTPVPAFPASQLYGYCGNCGCNG